ncbi:MAG: dihydropteroate synthase [Thermodesulfobacteriota bacterium]
MLITTPHQTLDLKSRPHIMGIVNVTPDSFSDGGQMADNLAREVGEMVAAGVDILDVGGESTRPGAKPVPLDEELARVIPAIERIRHHHTTPISVDTSKAEVARQALEAGADIINDISALRFDPAMLPLAVAKQAPLIIMHMQGTPGTMQQEPHYDDVVGEIKGELNQWLDDATAGGLAREKIIIDPGIGFGKTLKHNLSILKHLDRFQDLGCPLLLGHSRKRFIGEILGEDDPAARDQGTAVISALAAAKGAHIIRVHNVPLTAAALKLSQAIQGAQ